MKNLVLFLLLVLTVSTIFFSGRAHDGLAEAFVAKPKLSHNITSRKLSAILPQDVKTAEEKSQLWSNVAGGLTFGGGLIGFAKGSKASLIAGSTFGGLLLISSGLTKLKNSLGVWMGSFVSSMLTYVMGKKFLGSQKFVPSGLIASLASISLIHNIWVIFLRRKKIGNFLESNEEEDKSV